MNTFTENQKIGEVVTKFPNAAEIFQDYRLDFCCGGDRPLKVAIQEDGQEGKEKEILEKVNKEYEKFLESKEEDHQKDWTQAPLDELVDHIVNTHHAYLFENLPKVSELAMKILRVHGVHHPELYDVYRLFHTIKMDLEAHLIKEETIQYPAIRKYLKTRSQEDLKKANEIIQELKEEHTGAGDILRELRKVTKDYEVPANGCESYKLTYIKLQEMESDIFTHVHLENNILFPRLQQLEK